MTTCKEEALRWVHRYALGGAAFAAVPLPVSTSAGLATLEVHLVTVIAGIYGEAPSKLVEAAGSGALSVVSQGLKFVACQATLLAPLFGIPIRMAIAGGTIESIGHATVAHFERKHPGKLFTARIVAKDPPPAEGSRISA